MAGPWHRLLSFLTVILLHNHNRLKGIKILEEAAPSKGRFFSIIKTNQNKKNLLYALTTVILFLMPNLNFAQAPDLGTAAEFVLFSTNGAVSNSGISHLTGNIGTNNGSSTAFGNVNGVMHDGDGASAQCAADLLIAYNQLNSTVPGFFPAS